MAISSCTNASSTGRLMLSTGSAHSNRFFRLSAGRAPHGKVELAAPGNKRGGPQVPPVIP
jgi:hypothetical protein